MDHQNMGNMDANRAQANAVLLNQLLIICEQKARDLGMIFPYVDLASGLDWLLEEMQSRIDLAQDNLVDYVERQQGKPKLPERVIEILAEIQDDIDLVSAQINTHINEIDTGYLPSVSFSDEPGSEAEYE
jgi:hypothetical protein